MHHLYHALFAAYGLVLKKQPQAPPLLEYLADLPVARWLMFVGSVYGVAEGDLTVAIAAVMLFYVTRSILDLVTIGHGLGFEHSEQQSANAVTHHKHDQRHPSHNKRQKILSHARK